MYLSIFLSSGPELLHLDSVCLSVRTNGTSVNIPSVHNSSKVITAGTSVSDHIRSIPATNRPNRSGTSNKSRAKKTRLNCGKKSCIPCSIKTDCGSCPQCIHKQIKK